MQKLEIFQTISDDQITTKQCAGMLCYVCHLSDRLRQSCALCCFIYNDHCYTQMPL